MKEIIKEIEEIAGKLWPFLSDNVEAHASGTNLVNKQLRLLVDVFRRMNKETYKPQINS